MLGIRKIKIRFFSFSLKLKKTQMILFCRADGYCLQKLHMIILGMGCLNKLECYIALWWKGLAGTNTLAYWAHYWVAKMKCCNYDPRSVFGMLRIRKMKIRCSCFHLKHEKQNKLTRSSKLGLHPKTLTIISGTMCIIIIVIILFQVYLLRLKHQTQELWSFFSSLFVLMFEGQKVFD